MSYFCKNVRYKIVGNVGFGLKKQWNKRHTGSFFLLSYWGHLQSSIVCCNNKWLFYIYGWRIATIVLQLADVFGGTATVSEQQQHETMQSKVGVLI